MTYYFPNGSLADSNPWFFLTGGRYALDNIFDNFTDQKLTISSKNLGIREIESAILQGRTTTKYDEMSLHHFVNSF
jgi:hypothetical protein